MKTPGRLSHTWFVILGSIVLPIIYLLSYAPAQNLRSIQSTMDPPGPQDPWMILFRPVEWMIDETPLREPLLDWGGVCRTDSIIELDMQQRALKRRYRQE